MRSVVDYLTVRARCSPFRILEVIRPAFGTTADCLTMTDPTPGVDGWTFRRGLVLGGDVRVGFIDYGGDHMRDWSRLDMSGSACEWVQDWRVMQSIPQAIPGAEVKRLDLAVTLTDGSVTHESVLDAFHRDQFRTLGRSPSMQQITGSDPTAGRTVYVGKRGQAKFVRCYEKGWELLKDLTPDVRRSIATVAVDGVGMVDPAKVYRCEVELRAKDGKVIPWQALHDERDEYFAGANPFFAGVLAGVQPRRIVPMPEASPTIDLFTSVHHACRSYGGVIRALVDYFNGDAERALRLLTAEDPSRALAESGVMTLVCPPSPPREVV